MIAGGPQGFRAWTFQPADGSGDSFSWISTPDGPAWSDANGWNQVPYYSTIQAAYSLESGDPGYTGQNNSPQGVILARSGAGVETWRSTRPRRPGHRRPRPTSPPSRLTSFTAYNALSRDRWIAAGGVRDHYNDETNVIGTWLNDLQNGPVPQPAGVSAADWQAVTTQIQSELQNVSYVQDRYGTNQQPENTVYPGKDMTVQTVGNYLSLSSGSSASTVLSIESLLQRRLGSARFPGLDTGDLSAIADPGHGLLRRSAGFWRKLISRGL